MFYSVIDKPDKFIPVILIIHLAAAAVLKHFYLHFHFSLIPATLEQQDRQHTNRLALNNLNLYIEESVFIFVSINKLIVHGNEKEINTETTFEN